MGNAEDVARKDLFPLTGQGLLNIFGVNFNFFQLEESNDRCCSKAQ